MALFQAIIGLLTLISTGLAGWALSQVVALGREVSSLRARDEAIKIQFEDLKAWLAKIETKLDVMLKEQRNVRDSK